MSNNSLIYKVVSECNKATFENQVNYLLGEGYRLHGNLVVTCLYEEEDFMSKGVVVEFSQALIK